MKSHTIFRSVNLFIFGLIAVTLCAPLATARVSAASASIQRAQTILTKYGIPVGPIDGQFGPKTARGLCAFRYITGVTTSRSTVTTSLMTSLSSFNSRYSSLTQVPAPSKGGNTTYVVVEKKCQAMMYVENGHYVRVLPVSTGMTGHNTPNGTYTLGGTKRGWTCSSSYPESCRTQTAGRYTYISNYGNMYNIRLFRSSGGYYVHGSTSVPTYPASHGCVRVTVSDSDWMYDHVGNGGRTPAMYVINEY